MADDTGAPLRPTLHVATVGHYRHGKTTLTAALTRALARRGGEVTPVTVTELDRRSGCLIRDPSVWSRGMPSLRGEGELPPHLTVRGSQICYATPRRAFVHVDCPGRRPWLKNAARCQALVDALILVVSAADSVQPQTHEHLVLARALGVHQVVVFISQCDRVQDLEWLDLVEHDTRELLSRCGFDGDSTPVVRGAALPALQGDEAWESGLHDLLEALTVHCTIPDHPEGEPLLYVHQPFSILGVGLVVEGRLRRGVLRRGDTLTLLCPAGPFEVRALDLEVFHRKVELAEAGQLVGIQLGRAEGRLARYQAPSGSALVPAGKTVRRLSARLELLPVWDGDRPRPLIEGSTASLLFGTLAVSGTLRLPETLLMPGEACDAEIELVAPAYLEPGMTFALRTGIQPRWKKGALALWGGTAGSGRVLSVS